MKNSAIDSMAKMLELINDRMDNHGRKLEVGMNTIFSKIDAQQRQMHQNKEDLSKEITSLKIDIATIQTEKKTEKGHFKMIISTILALISGALSGWFGGHVK